MRLVVVGRDWGWQEAAAGRPFVGPSGKLLTRAMQQAGIDRTSPDVIVTNVVNKRPARDEWGAHAPGDVQDGLDKLQQTLTIAKPQLIVALGEHALQAVTKGDPHFKPPKKHTIAETRGYVFESPYGPTLALVHPAFILRTWHPWWATFCWDWHKAARLLKCAGLPKGGGEPRECIPAPDLIRRAFDWEQPRLLAVDIETSGTGAGCKPVCIAFAWKVTEGAAFAWTPTNLLLIKYLLESSAAKVFHNGQFDVTILERAGCPVANWAHDTMLLFHAIDPLIAGKLDGGSVSQKSLRFLVSLLCDDQPWYKDYNFETEEDQLRLCARDARLTYEIYQKLTARLTAGALHETRADVLDVDRRHELDGLRAP